MLVSIIIPVYNVSLYIEECLESIMSQTIQEDIECIIVDDCGSDNSMSIAENTIERYKNGGGEITFIIIHHNQNRGLSAARNSGILASRGKYLLFVDSDDKLFPNSISALINVAYLHQAVEIVQGSTEPAFMLSRTDFPDYSNNREWLKNSLCSFYISDAAWNKLINRDFLVTNNLFFKEGFLQEDTLWSYQIQKYIHSMAFSFETTYWYRYNPNGIMNGMSQEREAKSFARVFNYVFNDLINCEQIETYEIKYLIGVAKKTQGYVGKKMGRNMLVTRNNILFNIVLRCSTNLSRFRSSIPVVDIFRKIVLALVRSFILNPGIKKLCNRKALKKGYSMIDFSQPI